MNTFVKKLILAPFATLGLALGTLNWLFALLVMEVRNSAYWVAYGCEKFIGNGDFTPTYGSLWSICKMPDLLFNFRQVFKRG